MGNAISARRPSFRNANRLNRIWYRMGVYLRTVVRSLGRVPVKELVRTQFPFHMTDSPGPPSLSLELTNVCNLACGYCTNPTTRRPKGMISEDTFARLLQRARSAGVYRVAVCGNGEPTLHPRYPEYVRRLAAVIPYVAITSNWQKIDREITVATLESAQQLNVSVDGTTGQSYEMQRTGGSFERLRDNLLLLKELRRSLGSKILVNIRVMCGATDGDTEKALKEFWLPYGDLVSKQYILDFGTSHSRSFLPVSKGRCTLPFKKLDVHWNGIVPMCSYSDHQTGNPEGLVLGNIREDSLLAMWMGSVMCRYREGHRRGDESMIPMCSGCPGRT